MSLLGIPSSRILRKRIKLALLIVALDVHVNVMCNHGLLDG